MTDKIGYELADGTMSTDYEVGDTFEVVDNTYASPKVSIGYIVTLTTDDGSHYPFFDEGVGRRSCCAWSGLKATPETLNRVNNVAETNTNTPVKTLADFAREYPHGWPSDEYEHCFTTGENWDGSKEFIGDFELTDEYGELTDVYNTSIKLGESWVYLCSRNEYEEYTGKSEVLCEESLEEWRDPNEEQTTTKTPRQILEAALMEVQATHGIIVSDLDVSWINTSTVDKHSSVVAEMRVEGELI